MSDWGDDGGGDEGWDDNGGGGDDDWNDGDDGGDNRNMENEEELTIELQIENKFYEADDLRLSDSENAMEMFTEVVSLGKVEEEQNGQLSDQSLGFVFKALRNIVSLQAHSKDTKKFFASYNQLLDFIPRVTRNEGQDAVNAVLSEINDADEVGFISNVYEITSKRLEEMKDQERLSFRVNMKLCDMYFNRSMFKESDENLQTLLTSCRTKDGQDDMSKGAELLECYAMQVKLSTATQNRVGLKALYEKTHKLTVAVKDPKSQSVIRECWGQMFGDQDQWLRAYAEFYSAFNSYSEIGNQYKAKQCLKYVVVANMLSGRTHNPFDAREARVYQNDKEIVAVEQLRVAHENMDVVKFNNALHELSKDGDDFIMRHLKGIIRDFQGKAIERIIKSYRRVHLDYLAQELKVKQTEVEELLIQLILDGRVVGKIDQVNGLLDLGQSGGGGGVKYLEIHHWATALDSLKSNMPQANYA